MTTQRPEASQDDDKYDPDQDPNEKRRIRDGYRDQIRNLEDQAKDFKNLDVNVLIQNVQRADVSFGGVRAPQEAILDSRLLGQMAGLAVAKARDLKHDGGGFDVDEFLIRISRTLGGRPAGLDDEDDEDGGFDPSGSLDWSKFARETISWSRRVPCMDFMLGPLSIEQKKRAVVKRAKVEKITDEEKVKPHNVTAEEIVQNDASDMNQVMALAALLKDHKDGPISAFELCINPESFPQSVENFFYLAFLIRDGRVIVDPSDDDDILISWIDDEEPDPERPEGGYPKSQGVWQLTEQLWKDAIEAYDITEPMFPTRPIPDEHTYAFYGS